MEAKSNPFDMIATVFNRMSRQFEQATEASENDESYEYFLPGYKSMAIDVVERDYDYVVIVDVPGFKRDDIDVKLLDNSLTVKGERGVEIDTEDGENYVRRERQIGTLSRSITLPEPVEPDECSATMDNGKLTITIPRAEPEESGRKIEIAPS